MITIKSDQKIRIPSHNLSCAQLTPLKILVFGKGSVVHLVREKENAEIKLVKTKRSRFYYNSGIYPNFTVYRRILFAFDSYTETSLHSFSSKTQTWKKLK